jgi:hypothetical protein
VLYNISGKHGTDGALQYFRETRNQEKHRLSRLSQIARGQFERDATADALQRNARRHDADGLIEKIHFVFAGDVTRLAAILLK